MLSQKATYSRWWTKKAHRFGRSIAQLCPGPVQQRHHDNLTKSAQRHIIIRSTDGFAWDVVQGVSLPQLRDMILGKAGSYVNLTFLREKDGESFRYDIELMRGDPNTVRRYCSPLRDRQQMLAWMRAVVCVYT